MQTMQYESKKKAKMEQGREHLVDSFKPRGKTPMLAPISHTRKTSHLVTTVCLSTLDLGTNILKSATSSDMWGSWVEKMY